MGDVYLQYHRSSFSTRLHRDRLYSAGHFWLSQQDEDLWRIGFTKFSIRMLGEPVEFEFEVQPDAEVAVGQAIGWLEGFKAVTDIYSPMTGQFAGANPELDEEITLIHSDPHGRGWLYQMRGEPGSDCTDVDGYAALLDATIDKMRGKTA